MKKIVLIAATNKRKEYPTIAKNMYSDSHIFREAYQYACIVADEVYILSPKYGVLRCDEVIESYTEEFDRQSIIQRKQWAQKVLGQLTEIGDLAQDFFEIIGEVNCYEFLIKEMNYYRLPFKDLAVGERLLYLKKKKIQEQNRLSSKEIINSKAIDIHKICKSLKVYNYLDIDDIPFKNGVYIMIDKNEEFKGYTRIVRIGTHRGRDRLKKRLKQHFFTENKNASILRKYIGSALLTKNNDKYVGLWDINTKNKKIYELCKSKIDMNKEYEIEKQVSKYLRENISFYCIEEIDYYKRLQIKQNIMNCLYKDKEFQASSNWLGRFSPKLYIAAYGLWNSEVKIEKEGGRMSEY